MRILSKYFIDGFYNIVNPIGNILEAAEIHPHVITGAGLFLSCVSGYMFWKGQIFGGGVLVPTAELMNACAAGVADMVSSVGYYTMGRVPIAGIEAGLPFSWQRTLIDKGIVFDERGLLDLVRQEYDKKAGVYYLGYYASDPYCLLMRKEVKSIEALKKYKIRAAGEYAKVFKSVGIPTVFIPAEEMYTSLATGAVDGVLYGGASGYYDMKLFEVAKYFYQPAFLASVTINHLVNKKFWASLPEDIKVIMDVANRELSAWMSYNYIHLELVKLKKAQKEHGVKVVTLPAAEMSKLASSAVANWDAYAKKGPACAKAVEIIKTYSREAGYIE